MSEFQEAALSEVPVSAIGRPVLWTRPVYTGTAEALAAKEAALFERLAEIAARHGVAKFATSLAAEDMVVTDAILRSPRPCGRTCRSSRCRPAVCTPKRWRCSSASASTTVM